MAADIFSIRAKNPGLGMTLDELGRAVQKAHRLDVPGGARIRVDVALDLSFVNPGAPVQAVHFTLPEEE